MTNTHTNKQHFFKATIKQLNHQILNKDNKKKKKKKREKERLTKNERKK